MDGTQNIAGQVGARQLSRIDENELLKTNWGERNVGSLEGRFVSDRETYKKFHPDLWNLSQTDWNIFGTLTWSNKHRRTDSFNSEILRQYDFRGLIMAACVKLRIKPKHLPYYHAMEWSLTDGCHYHFLIAKDARQTVSNEFLAQFLQDYWTKNFVIFGSKKLGAGTAVVHPYDKAKGLRGVAYCLKRNFDAQGNERERFDMYSPALVSLLTNQAKLSLN